MAAPMMMTRSKDSFYVRDCQQIQTGTVAVQNLAGQISRQMHLAENEHDLTEIQGLIDRAVTECAEIQTLLRRFQEYAEADSSSEQTSRKMMQRTLSDNVSITARVLEDIIQNFLEISKERQAKELAALQTASASSAKKSLPSAYTDEGIGMRAESSGPLTLYDEQVEARQIEEAFADLHQNRQQSMIKVESDMIALKQIYTELSVTAENQQGHFDSIESSLMESGHYTSQAVDQFLMADERMGTTLKRKIKVAAVVLGFLFVIVFFSTIAPWNEVLYY